MLDRRSFLGLSIGAFIGRFLPKPLHHTYVNKLTGDAFESPIYRSDLEKTLFKYYSESLTTILKRNTDFGSLSICKPLPFNGGNTINFFTYDMRENEILQADS